MVRTATAGRQRRCVAIWTAGAAAGSSTGTTGISAALPFCTSRRYTRDNA